MKKETQQVHYGQAVRERVKHRGMTVAEFARRIIVSRTTVYNIFKRKYIDIQLLNTISEVLEFDFIRELHLELPDVKHKGKCEMSII